MIDDPVSLAATAQPAADGYGAVIDSSLLPAGVTEIAAGGRDEAIFVNRVLAGRSTTGVHWQTMPWGNQGVFLRSLPESADQFHAQRIDSAGLDLVEAEVGGQRALIAAATVPNPHTTVMWNDGQRTYIVTGWANGNETVDPQLILDVARSLRPATAAEWSEMIGEAAKNQAAMNEVAVTTTTSIRTG